jgi:hypothetical protein
VADGRVIVVPEGVRVVHDSEITQWVETHRASLRDAAEHFGLSRTLVHGVLHRCGYENHDGRWERC